MSAPEPERGEPTAALGWVGVVLLVAAAAVAAWIESLLVPLYAGGTLVPVTVVAGLATTWFLPRLARSLVPTTIAALLPFLGWLAIVILMSASARPEGDVVLPGGGNVQYVGYGLMLGGALAGTLSIVTSMPPPVRRR